MINKVFVFVHNNENNRNNNRSEGKYHVLLKVTLSG